jgi:outer membrane receptor protein involved in Fe transport
VAEKFVSNQYLFSFDDFSFAQDHFVHTDHAQTVTASAGASYVLWDGTRASVDMIYGSGLRNGPHNTSHLPGYTQVNLGLSHEFAPAGWNPFTVRFDVVNLFDEVYEIRDGTGTGVFAPQFGPRRSYFVGLTQKF